MKLLRGTGFISLLILGMLAGTSVASAATSPGLGAANSFVILSDTYSNTTSGTTLNGSLGYTTPPATAPTVNGATHIADSTYNQAGIDQGNALSYLNNQPCTYNFPSGPIDLATDTTHGPVGVYTPGVYCLTGAGNAVSSGNITLNGGGTYIFRMDGALTTGANSNVILAGGASACDIWWTPTAASTLGANSTFAGTNIDAAGITIGSNVTWVGQALSFGGTVTTDADTISAPTCSAARGETPSAPTTTATPGLPNTGLAANSSASFVIAVSVITATVLAAFALRKKFSL